MRLRPKPSQLNLNRHFDISRARSPPPRPPVHRLSLALETFPRLVSYLLIEEAKCQWLCEDHGPFYHDVLDNVKTATDLSHTAECECDDDALADVEALRAAGAKWYNHIEIPWFTLIAVRGFKTSLQRHG